jgi:hypothetical protein
MSKRTFFAVCILALKVTFIQCQNWIRIYEGNEKIHTRDIYEHYDKGFIASGHQWEGNNYFGWIMKTDINGYERWSKHYGRIGEATGFTSSYLIENGGIVCFGGTNQLDENCDDPIIVKINACGQKEWCKIFNSGNCNSSGNDIVAVPGGGYMALIQDWINGPDVWLFRLDSSGGVIWTQNYVTDPNIFWSPVGKRLLCTYDTCILLTGRAYTPDSLTPGISLIKMFNAKVDLNGEVLFELPWGMNNGMISEGHQTVEDKKHRLYSAGRRVGTTPPTPDMPSLFITSSNGYPIQFSDLRSTGLATTINWLLDSTLVLGADFQDYNGGDTVAVAKLDTTGNILKTKTLITNENIVFEGSDVTYDNKIILVGNTILNWQYSYLFKLNSNLEYDSIYTAPFTYDSLCPYPIVSDTIPLDDCEVVVVGIDEALQNPETTKLKVYPNPSDERITIELPKYLVRKSSGQGMTANTIYHQWKDVRLEVFDLYGQLMFCETVPQQKKSITLNVSSWSPGMYLARLVFMNEVVAKAKFVVE